MECGRQRKYYNDQKNKPQSDPDDTVFLFDSVVLGEYIMQIEKV